MDIFRKAQKAQCGDGSKNKRGRYGCACCRDIATLGVFKKVSRRLARVRLSRLDQKTNFES
jgi:hypothetical protein